MNTFSGFNYLAAISFCTNFKATFIFIIKLIVIKVFIIILIIIINLAIL